MAKTVYEATAPDGTVITRTTDRVYTHAVLAKDARGWGYIGFCGRLDLAQGLLNSWRGRDIPSITEYALVPVVPRAKRGK